MNNHELYVKLRTEVGATGTVYFREGRSMFSRIGEAYIPAHIMELEVDPINDALKIKILRCDGKSSMDNVSVADIYLPSPMNSRSHGDMVPVRTYFEIYEREQGSNGAYFNYRYTPGTRRPAERYAKGTKFEYNKIIFSGPCTIVIWKDGTKTMARVSEGDTFDPEKGVAICFMKRALGHTETNKTLKVADEMLELLQAACADVDVTQATAKEVEE